MQVFSSHPSVVARSFSVGASPREHTVYIASAICG